MTKFNLVGIALVTGLILSMWYVIHQEMRCKNLGGVPIQGRCVKLPLIDMEQK